MLSNHHAQAANSSATTVKLLIEERRIPVELKNGLKEIARWSLRGEIQTREEGEAAGDGGEGVEQAWRLEFVQDSSLPPGSLQISTITSSLTTLNIKINYTTPISAFRSLGHVLSVSNSPPLDSNLSIDLNKATSLLNRREDPQFETIGTMIDCSRNGVLKKESVFFLCRMLSLMGYNMIQLYTEDTYEIEGEPFFGYLRGPYTHQELNEIDQYAFDLGIEAVPCIQTLGHLGQVLQWPRFLLLRDTTEVLLSELSETYSFLTKMITTATSSFRSKRIHLGMDETHGLGQGRFHQLNGYKNPTQIFVQHLQKVNQICQGLELKPMIWSDMLFCLPIGNNSLNGYYDGNNGVGEVEGIPENVELVYWDYYHTSVESYERRIENHWELGRKSPWMAAGSWTWSRFWTALPFTFATCRASLNASKKKESGVKHVFLTIWGDEGNEVDLYSSLPAWSYYAEHCYTQDQEVNVPLLRSKFSGCVSADFDAFVLASRLDDVSSSNQSIDDKIHFAPNTSKWLLWEDPILGFVSPSTELSGIDLASHYSSLAIHLRKYLSLKSIKSLVDETLPEKSLVDLPFNSRLRFPLLLAEVLKLKAGLRRELHDAYRRRDWNRLDQLGGRSERSRLSLLRKRVLKLSNYHREMWMSMYKPFGFETLDLRYGGLQSRLQTLHARVSLFLDHILSGGTLGVSSNSSLSSTISGLSLQTQASSSSDRLTETLAKAFASGVMLNPGITSEGEEGEEVEEQEVTEIPELEVELQLVYGSGDQLLDYHRVSRPTYV